jgi:hypothetical protein
MKAAAIGPQQASVSVDTRIFTPLIITLQKYEKTAKVKIFDNKNRQFKAIYYFCKLKIKKSKNLHKWEEHLNTAKRPR